jgi:hypothetical protein
LALSVLAWNEQGLAAPGRAASPENVPYPHRPWALFDPFLSPREMVLFGGPNSLRELDQIEALRGGSFGFAQTQRELRGPFWLSLERHFELGIYSKWTFLLELSKYDYLAGFRLGPVEIGAGPGVTPLAFDISDGDVSLSGLCPRVLAKFGVKTGRFRFSLRAQREYLWRWLGRDDAWITGFALELAIEAPRRTHFGVHPVVFTR